MKGIHMPKFLLAFHGGTIPDDEAAVQETMAAWGAWYQSIGAGVVDGGAPVGKSHTVSAQGIVEDGGANPVSGYCIIEAADYGAATEIASRNPMVTTETGTVEVAQFVDM